MLTLNVKGFESFNNKTQTFVTTPDVVLKLEHSLSSLSKWESRWEKPFLSRDEKSTEEIYDYINCMSLEGDVSLEVCARLTDENLRELNGYIESKMSATWFATDPSRRPVNGSVVTAEVMYHWLVALNIPFECEHWHLNRLITLVRTINEKNAEAADPKKKKPLTRSALDSRKALNEARRREMQTSG